MLHGPLLMGERPHSRCLKRGSRWVSTASVSPFSPSILLSLSLTLRFPRAIRSISRGPSPIPLTFLPLCARPVACPTRLLPLEVKALRSRLLLPRPRSGHVPLSRYCSLVIPRCQPRCRRRVRQLAPSCRPRWARCRLRAHPWRLPRAGRVSRRPHSGPPWSPFSRRGLDLPPSPSSGWRLAPSFRARAVLIRRFPHLRVRAWGWSPWRRFLHSARPSPVFRRSS